MKITEILAEEWSQKYKNSINCSHPKGFSQRAHCAGKKKHNESAMMEMTCPDCGMCQTHGTLNEIRKGQKDANGYTKCWPGHHAQGTKPGKNGGRVRNCVPNKSVAEGKITLSTDPNWYGATVDNYQATGPVVNIPANQLVGFEPDAKMNQPKSKANVEKIVAGLKQGAKLPPLLIRKYKNGYQVLDGHHRFWAYKLLGVKSIPAQIVPDSDIEEISKQGVAESTELAEEFDLIESIIEDLAASNGVDSEVIWEDLESLSDDELYVFATTSTIMENTVQIPHKGKMVSGKVVRKDPVSGEYIVDVGEYGSVRVPAHKVKHDVEEDWQKANKKDRTNGMSRKAVKAYRREHPGSKLQTAVTTKPSKLKKGSKASKRRKSYCSRSRGQMKMHNISCAKTPDKAICKARRRWNC